MLQNGDAVRLSLGLAARPTGPADFVSRMTTMRAEFSFRETMRKEAATGAPPWRIPNWHATFWNAVVSANGAYARRSRFARS
jgi:hypothetical protein